MSRIQELTAIGQSIWLDFIRRSFLTSGEFQALVDQGVRGVTSNPSIFEKAIGGSADYDADLISLVDAGKSVEEIYETLAIDDIRRAADILRPVYDESKGDDGYVSLEVSPTLAHETQATINEAKRLFETLDRPNIMIKIPATKAGVFAIEAVISQGVNVNATLIFSLAHYEGVAQAYISGLEKLAASGGDVTKIASVASFFVSRVDTTVDQALEAVGDIELQGAIAVANAKIAYARFKELFSGERWQNLALQGARVQRPLWASTGTKNPNYPDTLYIDSLIGPHTVNTVPPATLQAFIDHGRVANTLESDVDHARAQLTRLAELGIDLEAVTQKLQDDGVTAFANSFEALMTSVSGKRERLMADRNAITANLFSYQAAVDAALTEINQAKVVKRIWAHDHTVWKPEPTEITNRLGWLRIAEAMKANLPQIDNLVREVRVAGFTHALLLGMGGSSLAPEVFSKTFGTQDGYLDLEVLDSTDPDVVVEFAQSLDLAKTLFIVSTKSGGTVETLSFFKYFFNRVAQTLGADEAGKHFVAITDPGSRLVNLAERYQFRATFLNDPNIGGRFSVLSYFGLVPAALIGMDVATLLERASIMASICESDQKENQGALLGSIMGELSLSGRDKVTFIPSPDINSLGDWAEQLIAESTGKEGQGILPVVGEPISQPASYGGDRLFVYLQLEGDHTYDTGILALEYAGHPVVRIIVKDLYDLGAQFFLWEFATAVAGYRLGINPFDQPNVEAAKVLARQMVASYQETGELPALNPTLQDAGITIFGDVQAATLEQAILAFLAQAQPSAYGALQAYVQPNQETDAALLTLRTQLRETTKMAVTSGYGPRFLHSTGQLHKGDAGKGLFIQFTSDAKQDADIPDEAGSQASSISFGVLKNAQALGDRQALLDAGRAVIRFHLGKDVLVGIARLTQALEQTEKLV